MKILIYILSSPSINPVYKLHKEVWLKYMNSNPDIDCFFIEYSLDENFLNENILIKENTIFIKGTESIHPGCRDKTFDCFEYFLNAHKKLNNTSNTLQPKNIFEYDYIIRTNMSSLWNFNALIKHLETLPNKHVYSGVIGYCPINNIHFASGAGIIMTPDIIQLIIDNRILANECNYIDDVDIAFILKKLGIKPTSCSRQDFCSLEMFNNYKYDDTIYHYRIKWSNNSLRKEEPIVMMRLLNMMN